MISKDGGENADHGSARHGVPGLDSRSCVGIHLISPPGNVMH